MSTSQQPSATRSTVGEGTATTKASAAFDTTRSCAECGGSSFDQGAAGEWFCRDCGVVHSEPQLEFTEPRWRPGTDRRTGPAASIDKPSVGTLIGHTNEPTPSWAKYNNRLTHKQRTLREGLCEVRSLGVALEASNTITERASYLFRRASNEDLLKGQSTEAMAAACVHAAARDLGTPFQVAHISDRSPVQKSTINNTFYKIVRELELPIAPPKPAEFVPRIASAVNLSVCIRERALDIIAQVVDAEEHVGQSPSGVAAAALYGAAQAEDQSITQSELADAAYVSVVTLSRQFQTVEKYI